MGDVSFDATEIVYTPMNGDALRIAWSDLLVVEIATTDDGPFDEDVFWVLHGGGPPLVVAQSVDGAPALLARLQELPGFDNEAVIAAMSSTDVARFLCWRRTEA